MEDNWEKNTVGQAGTFEKPTVTGKHQVNGEASVGKLANHLATNATDGNHPERIVVMGGSFNPPTLSHSQLLLAAMDALHAVKGIFVPVSRYQPR